MQVLAIGAHPDDIEYGCGGLLLQAVAAGHRVFLHVLTDGAVSAGADRQREQENAAAFLGAEQLFWEGLPDTTLTPGRPLITAVERVLKATQPDLVLVNSPNDAHQDHQALGTCATTACRYIPRVLFYHDYTTLDFTPDTFVDIGGVLDQKRQLLACHASQVNKDYPTGLDLLESVSALAAFYGFQAKVKYAEAYKPLRNLIRYW